MNPQERRNRKAKINIALKLRLGKIKERQLQSSPERMKLLEITVRQRAQEKGKIFYYFHRRCPVGHFSKRLTVDGMCYKCFLEKQT